MVAETYKVSRKKQDEYALISHTRASEVRRNSLNTSSGTDVILQSVAKGIFADEIVPVTLRGAVVSVDDTVRPGVTLESLSGLKSAFPNWGESSTTAGNASGVGDGAAICVMTTRERAEKEGMEIIGKWVGSAVVGECGSRSEVEDVVINVSLFPQVWSPNTWVLRQLLPSPSCCPRSDYPRRTSTFMRYTRDSTLRTRRH